jgi:hypothetical protein
MCTRTNCPHNSLTETIQKYLTQLIRDDLSTYLELVASEHPGFSVLEAVYELHSLIYPPNMQAGWGCRCSRQYGTGGINQSPDVVRDTSSELCLDGPVSRTI